MKFLFWSNILLAAAVIFLALSLFNANQKSAMDISIVGVENQMAKYFLERYPDAKIQGYMISKEFVKKEIEKLRKDCGPDFKEQDYWEFQYNAEKENKSMSIWIDPYTNKTVCVIQNIIKKDIFIPFGIKQERETITVRRGQAIKEPIYFYSVNGNKTYYVDIKVGKKPPWILNFDPPAHIYKPIGKDSIVMNTRVEPSELELFKPEKYPSDVSYIKLENGYVKASPVTFTMETPKPIPYKPYPEEEYELQFNVTVKYYGAVVHYVYKSFLLNYTIVLKEIK